MVTCFYHGVSMWRRGLNMKVLALSSSYEPVGVIPWTKAVNLLYDKKVSVLETYDREIRSPSVCMKMPSVVVYKQSFFRGKRGIRFSRKNIFLRDEGLCQYCNKMVKFSNFTLDHVVPKWKGGLTSWDNIVTCCYSCNQKKGEKTVKEAGMYLYKLPKQPATLPYVSEIDDYYLTEKIIPETWRFWIGR